MTDRRVVYAAGFLRAVATSQLGILLGFYLPRVGLSAAEIGVVVGAGLVGAACAAAFVTFAADRAGRRRSLVFLALLGAGGAAVVATTSRLDALVAASFLGMLNGAGRDRGASSILDLSILPGTTDPKDRTTVFARYHVLLDVGHALGAPLAALPLLLRSLLAVDELTSLRLCVGLHAALVLATAALYLALSPAGELRAAARAAPMGRESRRLLLGICALFAVDSLAGGFLTASLLSYFFHERFGVAEGAVAALFFGARVANAASHLAAAWLARRIGLLNTMVFTHIPSSLLLATVPFAPTFPVAAILFLLREGLVEMDVPTRQSYVMAMVQPSERTTAAGVTHLVRLGGWALAPSFAGMFMSGVSLAAPLFIGAGMKIAYDALLYVAYRRRRPPEEMG